MMMTSVLAALGAVVLVHLVYKTMDSLWLYMRPSGLKKYLHASTASPSDKPQPAWALVTGASDGIGKALSWELAKHGFNVVLHGRNPSKLEGVKAALSKTYPDRSFRILIADCYNTTPTPNTNEADTDTDKWLDDIVESLKDINLTLLINNAGGGTRPRPFDALPQHTPKAIRNIISLNAVFPTLLTAALLPHLQRSAPSLVLNIGSLSDNGLPLVSFYGASKAYLGALSGSVTREMRMERGGVDVLLCRLGLVTGISHRIPGAREGVFAPAAGVAARAILERVGCGRVAVIPYWGHALQQAMLVFFPRWVAERIMIDVMRGMRAGQDETVD